MSHHATDVTEYTERDAATTATNAPSAGGCHCHVSAATRDFLSSFAIVAGGCAALLLIVREPFVVSSGAVLWIATLWLASLGLGQLCHGAGIPPLLGSLVAGLALRNGVDAFDPPPRFGELIEHVGLCVILLMSSTDIDVHAVARAGGIALRLTFLPGLVEAAACAGAAHWLFDMPPAFALSLGFMLAAVSPAIVMPGMSRLQRAGFGVAQGIPSIVMAACAMDDIVAITGYTICIGVALDEQSHGASVATLALSAFLHGPVAILLGVATGGVGGLVLAATRFCPRAWQRAAVALELALLMTFGYKRAGFEGSGPVATLLMGTVAKLVWEQKRVVEYTQCSGTDFLDDIGLDVNVVWDLAIRPLLFGGIGAAFHVAVLRETLGRSCAVVLCGLAVRLPAAYLAAAGRRLSARERLFVAAAWTPKATVQAALAGHALAAIEARGAGDAPDRAARLGWGTQILATAVLAIVLTAPAGLAAIQCLGPRLLARTEVPAK